MGVIVLFLIESSASIDTNQNWTIKKMSNIHVYNDSTYSVSVLFNSRTTKEQRKIIRNCLNLIDGFCYTAKRADFSSFWGSNGGPL